jgi:uncharacterized Zn finger protein (UPF0148 family)
MIRAISNSNHAEKRQFNGAVYCPICTHTVQATVETNGRSTKVKRGQKCGRCSAALDAAYVFSTSRAA